VIPADLSAELARAIGEVVDSGMWPAVAVRVTAGGTWRPAPDGAAGRYATSLPFELGRLMRQSPAEVADRLARLISAADWIGSAEATGDGYLTITVIPAALAGVAVRLARAGPECARSDALRGVRLTGGPLPDLVAAASWQAAWQDQAAALTGRLAEAAGATVTAQADRLPPGLAVPGPLMGSAGSVAGAVGYVGVDAVRYWLARRPASPAAAPADLTAPAGRFPVTYDLGDPWYAVSFAHADAASVLRWGRSLGVVRLEPDERLAGLLGEPAELALLTGLSWLGERVAGAARRGEPAELPRYLEELAAQWQTCRENCPALPFGGRAAPRDRAGISARLWLAAATAAALAAGLRLMGISARERL
jgi:arginyl-tRNA synthetase